LHFLDAPTMPVQRPCIFRCDAITGAAEWISAVERLAHDVPGLVATVGKIEAKPGAANVIAGEARLSLDIRHGSDELRTRAVNDLIREAHEIATTPRTIGAGRVSC